MTARLANQRWDPLLRRTTPRGVADTPRTTRDVTPADVADVVADPRRATVTFVDGGEPAIVPVQARREGPAHLRIVPTAGTIVPASP